MTTIFEVDGTEVALSDAAVQEIAESYAWPYEWEVASRMKIQRDDARKQVKKLREKYNESREKRAALRERLTRCYAGRRQAVRERNKERRKQREMEAVLREINEWIGTEAGSEAIPFEPPWYAKMHKILEDSDA